jgi:ABC-2 type transport system ATP-binding protein
MKQRLAIASALLNNPEILILDEPTNGLDPQGIHQIREIIKKIAAQGTTILLASHLLDEVEKVCTHVVVLRKGEKLYAGPVSEMQSNHGFVLLNSAKADALKVHLEHSEDFEKISLENGLLKAYLTRPIAADQLNKKLMEEGFLLSHLSIQKDSLEAQFLALTKNN